MSDLNIIFLDKKLPNTGFQNKKRSFPWSKYRSLQALIGLFFLAFCIRFPFFFRDYIDKDESTFILMGQAWTDGFLPYTYLWDLKPPLTFGFFSAVIALFGKSFFWIRMGGVLLVSYTAFLVYKMIFRHTKNSRNAIFAAILSVLFSSLFGSVQGVMSEHISMALFMSGLYFITATELSSRKLFIGGLFLGLSAMAKLNLAYAILLLGLFMSTSALYFFPLKKALQRILSLGIGILIAIGVTAVPYIRIGAQELWWKSIFLASGSYAQFNWLNTLIISPFILLLAVYVIRNKSFVTVIIGVCAIGVLSSFVVAGKVNGHYLLQIYPLVFILLGLGLADKKIIRPKYLYIWLLILFIAPLESYIEYGAVYKNYQEKGRFYNGEGIDIASYLKATQIPAQNALFFEYHILYWILDKTPPSMAVTHPSNLFRQELFPYFSKRKTSQEELQYLIDSLAPAIIVIDQKHSLFKGHPKEGAYFEAAIKKHYRPDTTIGKGIVYTRR